MQRPLYLVRLRRLGGIPSAEVPLVRIPALIYKLK